MNELEQFIVIYDGHCDFCIAWLHWLRKNLAVTALSFHDAELTQYGLTLEECSQSVFVVSPSNTYAGSAAIAFLLKERGNRLAARLIRWSGPLGHMGYRWVATHRNSLAIRYWTKALERRLAHEG